MIVATSLGELGCRELHGLGFAPRVSEALRARVASVQPETSQPYARDYGKVTLPNPWNYTVKGPEPLTDREKQLQKIVLARDWDALFALIPLNLWRPTWLLGKYSFVEQNGRRRYVPFSRDDIRRFVFSDYYTVEPGWTCTDQQREGGVHAHWTKTQQAQAMFPATHWQHVWPINPGGGYPGQRFGCEKPRESLGTKLKKVAVVATVVVGGVFLGKVLLAKAAAGSAAHAGAAAAAAGAPVGAAVPLASKAAVASLATKAGTVAALSTGAGTAAAAAAAAGGILSGATTAGGIVGTAAKALPLAERLINGARTVQAIANGELPPPPISLGDKSLTDYAVMVGQHFAEKDLQRKMSDAEAEMLREMIERERYYLARSEEPHPPVVNTGLDPAVTAAQKTRADAALSEGTLLKVLAIGLPVLVLLTRGG